MPIVSKISDKLRLAYSLLAREFAKFGVVGAVAFVVDVGLYNSLVFGLPIISGPERDGPMADIPLRAKMVATSVAVVVAWLGNRYWTFRHRKRPQASSEFVLFVVFNVVGLAIAVACLGFSRYVLQLHSQLADNISGNGIGLVLGTLFRFWAYRTFVFRSDALADIDVPGLDDDPLEDEVKQHRRGADGEQRGVDGPGEPQADPPGAPPASG